MNKIKEKIIDVLTTIIGVSVLATGVGVFTVIGVCFLKEFIPAVLELPFFIKLSFGIGFIVAFIYYLIKIIKNWRC